MKMAVTSKQPAGPNAGFTLVGALVALAIISVIGLMVSKFLLDTELVKRSARENKAPDDIRSVVEVRVKKALVSYFQNHCKAPFRFPRVLISKDIQMRSSSAIRVPSGVPTPLRQAVNRCRATPRGAQENSGVLFCLRFDFRPGSGDKNQDFAFASSDFAFAEVLGQLRRADTLTPLSCQSLEQNTAPPNTEIAVYYSLYWGKNRRGKVVVKSRNHAFLMNYYQ